MMVVVRWRFWLRDGAGARTQLGSLHTELREPLHHQSFYPASFFCEWFLCMCVLTRVCKRLSLWLMIRRGPTQVEKGCDGDVGGVGR